MIYCRYYDLLAAPLLALLLGVGGLAGVTVGDTLPCLQHHALSGGGQRQLALPLLLPKACPQQAKDCPPAH